MLLVFIWSVINPLRPALAEVISGTYVGKGNNSAFLVQIVETTGGHLTGRYEQVVLRPTGQIDDMNATISGASDGRTVVVSIKPGELLSGTIVASGTVEGRLMHLTGGGNGGNMRLDLLKSDEADFRTEVAALTEHSKQIIDARAQNEAMQQQAQNKADQLSKIQNFTERLTIFTAKAEIHLSKLAPAEQRFRDITQRMRAALTRELSIYGSGQAAIARSQISIAINQAAIQANLLHINLESSYDDFDSHAAPLLSGTIAAGQDCHGAHTGSSAAPIPTGYEDLNFACLHYFEIVKKFQTRVSDLRAVFAQIERVWTTERREQDAIVKASDLAVQ